MINKENSCTPQNLNMAFESEADENEANSISQIDQGIRSITLQGPQSTNFPSIGGLFPKFGGESMKNSLIKSLNQGLLPKPKAERSDMFFLDEGPYLNSRDKHPKIRERPILRLKVNQIAQ